MQPVASDDLSGGLTRQSVFLISAAAGLSGVFGNSFHSRSRTRPGALLILAHRPRNLGNRDGVHAGLLRNPPLEKMHLRLVGGREGEGREPIAMLIPNNLPGIVGPARSIITSASLLRRAVRPPTRNENTVNR